MTAAQQLRQEGRQEGKQEGLQLGMQEGLQLGMQKGLQEGRALTIMVMAKKLLLTGVSIEQIQQCTGLSVEAIKKLRQNKVEEYGPCK